MFYQTVRLSMFFSDLLKASRVTATVIIILLGTEP